MMRLKMFRKVIKQVLLGNDRKSVVKPRGSHLSILAVNVILLILHMLGLAADLWNSSNYILGTHYTSTTFHILHEGKYIDIHVS
jgi:hypothetical protein